MNPIFSSTYRIISLIGQGGMSKVYLVEHIRLKNKWAMKEVNKNQDTRFNFLAESNILKNLHHPMLPQIVDIYEDDDKVYIIEDYIEGITLDELLRREKRVDELQCRQWFYELAEVLKYLHSQVPNPIIYRDMKPSNIMLQHDGSIKLIDFGIAREYKQQSSADTTYIGTQGYAAPEQFGTSQTDERTDVYSLGVTMYHLLTGKSPYEPPYTFVPVRELDNRFSVGIEYILKRCIQAEPENRYQNAKELLEDLTNIYRFDNAYIKYIRIKRIRRLVIALMILCSIAMMSIGYQRMKTESVEYYNNLIIHASQMYESNPQESMGILKECQQLFPDNPEAFINYSYALYKNREYENCISYIKNELSLGTRYDKVSKSSLYEILGTAYFEIEDYANAAEYFRLSTENKDITTNSMRDYAVALGKLGFIDSAGIILDEMIEAGAEEMVTIYVRGEVHFAQKRYVEAEIEFLSILDGSKDTDLQKRALISLAELYRDCTDLGALQPSPIENPNDKEIAIIKSGMSKYNLQENAVLWEMIGAAYYNGYLQNRNAGYLKEAALAFQNVINLGVQKDYIYSNLFAVYEQLKDYSNAQKVLDQMKAVFPKYYVPYALNASLMIIMENCKPESKRNYFAAYSEYQTAKKLVNSSDDKTKLQQLEGLINQLQSYGWLN